MFLHFKTLSRCSFSSHPYQTWLLKILNASRINPPDNYGSKGSSQKQVSSITFRIFHALANRCKLVNSLKHRPYVQLKTCHGVFEFFDSSPAGFHGSSWPLQHLTGEACAQFDKLPPLIFIFCTFFFNFSLSGDTHY